MLFCKAMPSDKEIVQNIDLTNIIYINSQWKRYYMVIWPARNSNHIILKENLIFKKSKTKNNTKCS